MGSYLRAPELESTEEAGPRPEEQLVNKAESGSREKWGGDGDSRGDSRSPLLQGHWWYLSLVTDCYGVHTHIQCACLWFSKSSYTSSVPANRTREKSNLSQI